MTLRTLVLGLSLLSLALPSYARENTDVIVMKNGDRLTGEIKSVDAGVLYAKLNYVDGTISIQWSQVARLESVQQFIVKTNDGSVHSGTLKTTEAPSADAVTLQVADKSNNVTVLDRAQIVKVDETSESFWKRTNGEINFGTTYSKGNQSTQYNVGIQTEYIRENWTARANFSSNLSANKNSNASTRNLLGLEALRLLPWKNYFYYGLGTFLQSSEQGITLQSNLGGGIGRYLKNTNRTSISVLAGMAWQSTNYEASVIPIPRQNVTAAMIGTDIRLFKFKKTNLAVNAVVFPALSEPGRVYFDTSATYYVKLFSNLSWNFSFYGNWDNQPPPTFSGSDYGTSSGLRWTFGNR